MTPIGGAYSPVGWQSLPVIIQLVNGTSAKSCERAKSRVNKPSRRASRWRGVHQRHRPAVRRTDVSVGSGSNASDSHSRVPSWRWRRRHRRVRRQNRDRRFPPRLRVDPAHTDVRHARYLSSIWSICI